jgi:tRNA-splicing ligase RtcB
MDLARLQQIDRYCWSVRRSEGEQRAEVKLYGSGPLLATMDDKVLEQITNVARLPGLVGCAMTMPDAHWGYGFPIGGVAAFDPERGGVISAGGVGFDISCGIRCLRTGLQWSKVVPRAQVLSDSLFRDIPAGVGEEGKLKLGPDELDDVLTGGAAWAVKNCYGDAADLEFVEERGCMAGAVPRNVSDHAKKNASAARWARWAPAIITSKCRWSTASTMPRPQLRTVLRAATCSSRYIAVHAASATRSAPTTW